MKYLISILVVVIVMAAAFFLYKRAVYKGVEVATARYIEAVKDKDFDTIFWLNERTVKQVTLIMRGGDAGEKDTDDIIKRVYSKYKKSFGSSEPIADTTLLWAEKSYFIPDMKYRVVNAKTYKAYGTPSASYRTRNMATVTIVVEYLKRDSSPVYKKRRIKKIELDIEMILARDVVKGIVTTPVKKGWLFRWFKVRDESLVYWND